MRLSGVASAVVSAAIGAAVGLQPARAGALFAAVDLPQERFVLVAAPIGDGTKEQLNIYEQLNGKRPCFAMSGAQPAKVEPMLATFDFTGICSRYLDSNGYSLRVGEEDLASRYRLRLAQQGNSLALLAMTPSDPTELLVGRGSVPLRDRDGFVQIQLEPGWQLQRRVYGMQTLSHVYFANATPLAQLLGAAGSGDMASAPQPLRPPLRAISPLQPLANPNPDRGPIALQVIPFRP